MKKIFSIVVVVIVLIVTVYVIELSIWNSENDKLRKEHAFTPPKTQIDFHSGIKKQTYDFKRLGMVNGWGRQPVGLNIKDKKPIVVFGNQIAYGFGLNDEQTFSYKLSNFAKVPVYNKSYISWGIQHMLYQFQEGSIYKQIPEPSYVIYILYSHDDMKRLYFYSYGAWNILDEEFDIRYKEKNGSLKLINYNNPILNQIRRLYSVNKLHHHYVENFVSTNRNRAYDFALKHFIAARNVMKKHWKNTKFVVIFFEYDVNNDNTYLETKLKQNGFITINSADLTKRNLQSDDYILNWIPTGKAWDLLTPLIVKNLGL